MTTYTGIDDLTVSLEGGVLAVTFNRPDSLNSLTAAMVETLCDALEAAATDPAVKVVRLGGAGRGFCAGAGISAEDQAAVRRTAGEVDPILAAINRAIPLITGLPKPVVAVVQGATAGVGVSLALAADIVIASETAFFLLAFTKIGLMPDGGASALVAASIGRARAMKMALLAERLPATEAFECGLVSSVHPAEELQACAAAVIGKLAAGPALALQSTKQAINATTLGELDGALARETEGQVRLIETKDFAEGTRAFQERRAAVFTGR
ncbi:MAG: enoyl-CoA hydratase [Mycobacterium sp.]